MTTWSTKTVQQISAAFLPQRDPKLAEGMRSYLKDQFEFLGIKTPERRSCVKAILKANPPKTAQDLIDLVDLLWKKKHREFLYAGCDALGVYNSLLDASHLEPTIRRWVVTTPWWDTVDSLGSAAISPIALRDPAVLDVMWSWIEDEDMWLNRAAIQHQRGFRTKTDLEVLFTMCERHHTDKRFWISKAIGWALRDVTAFNPRAVSKFLKAHPELSSVARREATRGLERAANKSTH